MCKCRIRNPKSSTTEEVRREISRILQTETPLQGNVSGFSADIENTTVLMNTSDYWQKIQGLIDTSKYEMLSRDSTPGTSVTNINF